MYLLCYLGTYVPAPVKPCSSKCYRLHHGRCLRSCLRSVPYALYPAPVTGSLQSVANYITVGVPRQPEQSVDSIGHGSVGNAVQTLFWCRTWMEPLIVIHWYV